VKFPDKNGLFVHAAGSGVHVWWKNASYLDGNATINSSSKSAHIVLYSPADVIYISFLTSEPVLMGTLIV